MPSKVKLPPLSMFESRSAASEVKKPVEISDITESDEGQQRIKRP